MNPTNALPTLDVPAETRLYYGVTYSVGVADEPGNFWVLINDNEEPIKQVMECNDIAPDDFPEILKRAHSHAQKIILQKQ